MNTQDLLFRLGIAVAIGFLIGLERGWREREEAEGQRAAGIRTFTLVGLLGGITGALSQSGDRLLLAAGLVTAGVTLAAFFWREGEREQDFSATSLVGAMLTYILGAFAVLGDVNVAAAAGVVTAILLASKGVLHGWLKRLRWQEIRSALQLAAMTFIALPLLPQRTIDPWGAINPHQLWLITILIASVSFAGYAASRLIGARRGLLVMAIIGGFVASTAATVSLARLGGMNAGQDRFLAGGILAAGAVMMVRVAGIAAAVNLALGQQLAMLLVPAAAGMAVVSLALVRSSPTADPDGAKAMLFQNPFDLDQVLRFGLLLAGVSVAAVLARQLYGDSGLFALAAASGLVDVDAITLSAARLPGEPAMLATVILTAVGVNTLAKTVYAAVAGGARIGLLVLAGSAAAAAGAGIAALA